MFGSDLLRRKNVIDRSGIKFTDLIHSTFKFGSTEGNPSMGTVLVGEFETMRPDQISDRIYGKIQHWDVLLKYNGISNPFSIQSEDFLYAPVSDTMLSSYKKPDIIQERDQKEASPTNPVIDPKTQKDKDRLKVLQNRVGEVLPPNVNRSDRKNIEKSGGKVIFGGSGKKKSSQNLSRARLQAALLNNNISI
jgi:hypothetical protein